MNRFYEQIDIDDEREGIVSVVGDEVVRVVVMVRVGP